MKRGRGKKSSGSTFWIIILCIIIVLLFLFIFGKSCHSYTFKQFSTDQLISYFPKKNGDMLFDAYEGPSKNDNIHVRSKGIPCGLPINVSTQGVDADYRQIGIVAKKDGGSQIFPLIGKPLFTHRDKWQYYVLNKQNIKLPVIINGKNSTGEYGADTLENNDNVDISGHSNQNNFKVELYENTQHQYIPI